MRWRDRAGPWVVALSLAAGVAGQRVLSGGGNSAGEGALPPELTPPAFRLPGGGRLTGVPYAPEGTRPSPESPEVLRWAAAVERSGRDGSGTQSVRASAYLAAYFGDLAGSRALLDLARTLDPTSARSRVDLAALALQDGSGQTGDEGLLIGLENAAAAANQRPPLPGAHFNLGLVLHRMGLEALAGQALRQELGHAEGPWREEAHRLESRARGLVAKQAAAENLLSHPTTADQKQLEQAVRSDPDLARRAFSREWSRPTELSPGAGRNLRLLGLLISANTGDELPGAAATCLEQGGARAEDARRLAAKSEAALAATSLRDASDGFTRAEHLFLEAGCAEVAAFTRTRRIVALLRGGRFSEAAAALPPAATLGGPYVEGWMESLRGWVAAERVDLRAVEHSYAAAASSFASASAFSQQGWMLGGVAWAQLSQQSTAKAGFTTLQAIRAAARAGDPGQLATVLEGAGELLNATGATHAATLLLEESLRIVQGQASPVHRSGLHWTLAEGYQRMNLPVAAAKNLRAWRTALDQIQDRQLRDHHEALYAWARARQLAPRDRGGALEFYSAALLQLQREDSVFGQTALLAERSSLLAKAGHPAEAEADLERGVALFEQQRRLLGLGASAGQFFSAAEGVFDSWVELLIHEGRTAEAAAVSDFGRARGLLDRIAARNGAGGAALRDLGPKGAPPVLGHPVLVLDQLPNELFIAWLDGDKATGRTVPLGKEMASRLVRGALAGATGPSAQAQRSWAALSSAILEGVPEEALRSGHLNVVTDEPYEHLPLASLRLLDGRLLGEVVSIVLIPSRRVAALLPLPRQGPGSNRTLVRLIDEGGTDHLPPLIRPADPGLAGMRILDLQPSLDERQLLAALETADAIQFVTHGVPDPNGDVHLLLRRADGSSLALGYEQIQALQLRRSPVVLLGACFSANGPALAQEGSRSLVRAFLAAGAAQVVAALGPVDDRALRDYERRAVAALAAGRPLPSPPNGSSLQIYGAQSSTAPSRTAASSMRQEPRRY